MRAAPQPPASSRTAHLPDPPTASHGTKNARDVSSPALAAAASPPVNSQRSSAVARPVQPTAQIGAPAPFHSACTSAAPEKSVIHSFRSTRLPLFPPMKTHSQRPHPTPPQSPFLLVQRAGPLPRQAPTPSAWQFASL